MLLTELKKKIAARNLQLEILHVKINLCFSEISQSINYNIFELICLSNRAAFCLPSRENVVAQKQPDHGKNIYSAVI